MQDAISWAIHIRSNFISACFATAGSRSLSTSTSDVSFKRQCGARSELGNCYNFGPLAALKCN